MPKKPTVAEQIESALRAERERLAAILQHMAPAASAAGNRFAPLPIARDTWRDIAEAIMSPDSVLPETVVAGIWKAVVNNRRQVPGSCSRAAAVAEAESKPSPAAAAREQDRLARLRPKPVAELSNDERHAAYELLAMAIRQGSESFLISVGDVQAEGQRFGDWEITIQRVKPPA